MFLSSFITHKAISASSNSLAFCSSTISRGCGGGGVGRGAVADAAAVAAAAAVALAVAEAAAAVAVIAVTPTDLMRWRPRYLNFLDYSFHYSLEIIFINLNN